MLWDATGQVNLLLQSILEDPRWLLPVTYAGDRIYLLVLVPVVLYLIGRRDALFLLFATAGTFYINSLLKLLFHQPRPFWVTQMGVYAFEASFGFPSGHAQNSLVVWGLFAAILVRHGMMRRSVAIPLFGLLIFLISISRIVFGAHFIQDTLFGWFVGSVILALFLWLEKPIQGRFETLNRRALFALMISLAGMLLALAYLSIPDQLPDIKRWNEMARLSAETTPHARVHFHDLNPTGMKAFLAVVGLLTGAAVSLILPAVPAPSASLYARLTLLSASTGLLGLLYAGTGAILTVGGWGGDVWHAVRYLLLTVSCLYVIPLLAAEIPLARRNEKE